MRSYEVIREAADKIGVKALAAELKLSSALVYKWCQEWSADDPDASGARNPLDRVSDIVRATGDTSLIQWLCHEAGGFFTPNPIVHKPRRDTELILTTQKVVSAFSELLEEVTQSIRNDGKITSHEAERIRKDLAARTFAAELGPFHVTCSLGVATFPVHAADKDRLVKIADELLYKAKQAGRNRTVAAHS